MSGKTYKGVIHAVDWLPTLVDAASGGQGGARPDTPEDAAMDGVSQWQSVLQGAVPSARTEFVYNIDELKKNAAIRQGKYKLIFGPPGHPDGWYPPPSASDDVDSKQFGEPPLSPRSFSLPSEQSNVKLSVSDSRSTSDHKEATVDQNAVNRSKRYADLWRLLANINSKDSSEETNEADYVLRYSDEYSILLRELQDIAANPQTIVGKAEEELLTSHEVKSHDANTLPDYDDDDDMLPDYDDDDDDYVTSEGHGGYLLFDLEADPTEHTDVKHKYPDVFKKMVARLEEYRKSLVPANFPPHDPAALPSNFNGTWSPGWC